MVSFAISRCPKENDSDWGPDSVNEAQCKTLGGKSQSGCVASMLPHPNGSHLHRHLGTVILNLDRAIDRCCAPVEAEQPTSDTDSKQLRIK